MKIGYNLIVAMDKNGLIGNGDKLPWHIPEDLKYFKEITHHKVVLMGRKTYESIPRLKGRIMALISRNKEYSPKYGTKFGSVAQFRPWAEYMRGYPLRDNIFIIGGAQIYKETFKYCNRLYITYVNGEYEGDTYFPISFSQINDEFEVVSRKISDKTNCEYIVMERIKNHEV